jgi:hypothetical protein
MNRHLRRSAWLALVVPFLMIPAACTLEPGYGYDGTANIGVGIDYYEPLGFDYGGWGGNYRSGPPRGGVRTFHDEGGRASHAYQPAPSSRPMPSLPTGSRGGGGGGRRR